MKQLSMYDTHINDEITGAPLVASIPETSSAKALPLATQVESADNTILLDKTELQKDKSESNDQALETRVTEIILSRDMANNLQLILPMLAHLNQENRWLAWVNPPIPLLKQWQHKPGLSIEDIMVLRSDLKTTAFEIARKALKAGSCHAVIVWADDLSQDQLDHLDKASLEGGSHGIVLRYR